MGYPPWQRNKSLWRGRARFAFTVLPALSICQACNLVGNSLTFKRMSASNIVHFDAFDVSYTNLSQIPRMCRRLIHKSSRD